jgi:hypothetical protein
LAIRRLRPGASDKSTYTRVTVALSVAATDVASALTTAWDAFRDASANDLTGWEITAASAEV